MPPTCIQNHCLEKRLNLTPGWVERRTGIKERRWASHETLVDLAEQAALMALNNAGISSQEIGMTILSTSTPDHLLPPSAPLLAHRLGLSHSGSFDLSGACCGFLYALALGDSFVRIQVKPILLVAANILSRRINLAERDSAVLFGDAAAAVVMAPSTDKTKGIFGINFHTDGSHYDLISIKGGGSAQPFSDDLPLSDYKMKLHQGQILFSKSIELMVACATQALSLTKLRSEEIQHFVPHQANLRISNKVAKKLNIPIEKMISTIDRYGNASAANIPLSLSVSHQTKPFITGEKILLTAAGAGMTGGALIIGL